MRARGEDRWERLLAPVALVAALLVVLPYLQSALSLVAYRWDWCPDEGLYFDYARRLIRSPGSLYTASVSPAPDYYGPVLPALLAPLVALFREPLGAARVLACLWTGLILAAIGVLVGRRAPAPLAVLMAALALAPFHLTFWYMLVRPDGPMLALWLWAAVVCLPSSLRRGADTLSWRRAIAGSLLITASVFAKPTAVLHGAPLVLGWLLVDLRSAVRLGGLVGGMGATVVAGLEAGSRGGYLEVIDLWAAHGKQPGLMQMNLRFFLFAAAPVLVLALLALLHRIRSRGDPWRDPAHLLILGGLALAPALGKYGALPHYLLPLLCGLVVFTGRSWVPLEPSGPGGPRRLGYAAGVLGGVVAALVLIRTETVPLPPRGAAATSEAFYGAVSSLVREGGRPLLALRPEYAYFVVDQPVEIEGSTFKFLLAAGEPGAREVLTRLENRVYRTVVLLPTGVTEDEPLARALHRGYASLGSCDLSYYSGFIPALIMVPRDRVARFEPPPGTRCRSAPAGALR